MDKIFEPIIKPLSNLLTSFFQRLGFDAEWSEAFSATVIALLVALLVWLAGVWLKRLQQRLQNNKTARDLKPEFDYLTIKGLRDIFIPTRFARITPNRYDNPHEAYKHNDPQKLIPFMIKKSFNERVENEKFYLILADSGMGKTAFMVNLYMAWHSLFNWRRRQNQQMKLFRFQPPDIDNPVDILDRLKAIEDKEAKNTILLLDGLDEDPFILSKAPNVSDDDAFVARLNKIAGSTRRFCDVVITCRTQYFPQEELQDYELTIRKPDNKGFYKLNKYYLFPFSDAEVGKYLNKKYGRLKFWNRAKKEKAQTLVKNSHKLMSRPMLLSYLDDLVLEEKNYRFSHEIYETLIEKWLLRESEKWKKSAEQERFRASLRRLARATALQIYRSWQSTGVLYLSKDDAVQIAQTHRLELKPEEVKGKSLLTCDPLLNWKFAHKSILEYFLAKECVDDWPFAFSFKFAGMDMAKHFYLEMAPFLNALNFVKVEGGTFQMGDEKGDLHKACRPVHQVTVADFYLGKTPVTQKQWREIMGGNPSHFKNCEDCPVENVSWIDTQAFIDKLKAKTGMKFRLPTEAEWESACRGGQKSTAANLYAGSDNLDEVGWYDKNSKSKTHPVAGRNPNELGLYDMSGNVYEWCQDWFDENYYEVCEKQGVMENPTGPETGSYRVLRGGSWSHEARDGRSASRHNYAPANRSSNVGFRPVLVP